ncbi:MAG TPA: tetratricopeptide repeat protein [Candidatus Kapabacteria bacterium]|nr:tetratricopeptide repeat protein [Candidatus Kapabacteria bacterium]
MKIRGFLILPLLLAAISAHSQPMSDVDFAQKFRLASVYENTHDYNNAVRVYEELYKARPTDPNISAGYVRTLYSLKRFADVEKVLTEVLAQKSPYDFDLYLLLGRTRAQLNKKAEAIEAFQKAEAASPQGDLFSVTIAVANAMVEAGYEEEALEFLQDKRKQSETADLFTPEIARLLYKLSRYDKGTREYLSLLHSNDANMGLVQMRIAQFTTDSTVRRSIMQTFISQIDTISASLAELKLLAWCYGELKQYPNALSVNLAIEGRIGGTGNPMAGFELVQFADRALAEGAYETAAKAYDEAAKRIGANQVQMITNPKLGAIKARQAMITKQAKPSESDLRDLIDRYVQFANSSVPADQSLGALSQAADIAFRKLHDLEKARSIYEQIIQRQPSVSDNGRNAYFALEEIALTQGNTVLARTHLSNLEKALLKRPKKDDEVQRHILYEQARIDYFEGAFDSSIEKLSEIVVVPSSDYANDAIALSNLMDENRKGSSDGAMRVFAKAELLALGSDINAAVSAYLSIKQTYPKSSIADESTLRAADLLVLQGKPNDAVSMLQQMQEQMIESPFLDEAALREAEITEHELNAKDKALKLYEDFLARFPKSPHCTEVRQRARRLRGDTF